MKNKGFTLIELLAVIILLAAVSLIVVPRVLNLIDKSNEDVFVENVQGLIRSVQTTFTIEDFNYWPEDGIILENGEFTNLIFPIDPVTNEPKITITVRNLEDFVSGIITKDEYNVLSVDSLTDGTFCAYRSRTDSCILRANNGVCPPENNC